MKIKATTYIKSEREVDVEFPMYRRNDVFLEDNHDVAVFERTSFDDRSGEFALVTVTLYGYYGDEITMAEIRRNVSSELEDRGKKYFAGIDGYGSDADEFKAATNEAIKFCEEFVTPQPSEYTQEGE